MPDAPKQITAVITDSAAQSRFINNIIISHSFDEFCMDMIHLHPNMSAAFVVGRFSLSPLHAKKLVRVLTENLSKYEKKFGDIQEPKEAAPRIGFEIEKKTS